jgi:hypothetical protein
MLAVSVYPHRGGTYGDSHDYVQLLATISSYVTEISLKIVLSETDRRMWNSVSFQKRNVSVQLALEDVTSVSWDDD